jgi:hypothetical protein
MWGDCRGHACRQRSRSGRAGAGRTCWRMRASSSPAASACRSPARRSARTWRASGCRRQLTPTPAAGGAVRVPRAQSAGVRARRGARLAAPTCSERVARVSAQGRMVKLAEAQETRGSMARECTLIVSRQVFTVRGRPARHACASSAEPAPAAEAGRRRRAESRSALVRLAGVKVVPRGRAAPGGS